MTNAPTIIHTLLRQQTPVVFHAHGPSMNPTIRDGDRIRVLPLSAAHLKPGGIVLYPMHERLVLHRLIHRHPRRDSWRVAADAALRGSDWIPEADILGVAESVIRDNGGIRLDTRRARWAGLLRYYARPLRRLGLQLLGRTS